MKGAEPWFAALRERAAKEPLSVDIADYSDDFCAGFLAGQVNALDAVERVDCESCGNTRGLADPTRSAWPDCWDALPEPMTHEQFARELTRFAQACRRDDALPEFNARALLLLNDKARCQEIARLAKALGEIEGKARWYADNLDRDPQEVDHALCAEILDLAQRALND